MKYLATVSGRIFLNNMKNNMKEKDIEIFSIFTSVGNNDTQTGIFDDINFALLENIETGLNENYYFLAVVESEFEKTESSNGAKHTINHVVTEIDNTKDIKNWQNKKEKAQKNNG